MTKKMGIGLICFALASSTYAREISKNQKFIGVEVNVAEAQGYEPNDVGDGVGFGLRIGARNEDWRTMFTVNYFDAPEHNVEKLFLSIDHFFMKTNFMDEYEMRPYMGLNVGYMNYESVGVNEDGLLYGIQTGVTMDLLEDVEFELGYRYSLSNSDELDHTRDVLFGINYQY